MPALYLIAFLLAANGLLVELNLSQVLSAVLGGTILRYHTSIGLFTLSLGLGSLLYVKIKNSISQKKLLVATNLIVGFLAILAPLFIKQLDPLSKGSFESLFLILSYLPIVFLGTVTGLELPLFFDMVSQSEDFDKNQRKILSFDYAGMFLASVLFPYLIFNWGVFNLSYLSFIISFVIVGLIYKLPDHQPTYTKEVSISFKKSFLFLFVALILSFCSMSYELVIAKLFTDLISNEIIAHSVTIGFYLLGLGLGAFFAESQMTKSYKGLLRTEVVLVLTSLLLMPTIYILFTVWKAGLYRFINLWWFMAFLQLITFWVGYWSGRELPYCISLVSKKTGQSSSLVLAFNYFGALIAGFVIPLLMLPKLGVGGSLFLTGFLNLLVLVLLLFWGYKKISYFSYAVAVLISLLIMTQSSHWNQWTQQVFLKTHYHELEFRSVDMKSLKNYKKLIEQLDDINRISTPYQYIDLVREAFPYSGSSIGTLTLYLNKQPQFSMDTWSLYHDSFSHGAINLAGKVPENVLILGGGDGLLAGQLIDKQGVQSVTMIELDHQMVSLGRRHREISQANKKVFDNPKLNLIYDDAFSWLKRNNQKFDAVFIDFPYPTSFELSRLYSVEFYEMVFEKLNQEGFMVLDAPVSFSLDKATQPDENKSPILYQSIKAAGFKSLFPFGPIEPFIFASKSQRQIAFDYNNTKALSNSSFVNLSSIQVWFDSVKTNNQKKNSLFHPIFLEFEL